MSIISGAISVSVMTIFKACNTMSSTTYQVLRKCNELTKALKYLTLISIAICAAFFNQAALAACTVTGDINRILDNYRSPDLIQIDSTLPIGATLGRIFVATLALQPDILLTCAEGRPLVEVTSVYPQHSATIFDTGIPGIGMSIRSHTEFTGLMPVTFQQTDPSPINPDSIFINLVYELTFKKTGYIPSGGQIPAGLLAQAHITDFDNVLVMNSILPRPITFTLLRPTCAVNTPNFTVDLREVSMVDFNASGRTLPKSFSIDLTCTGGTNSADVYVTLTDANNPANATSQLGLSPDSTAEGIALEVNNRFGAVNFGPDLDGLGHPGQWNDGSTGIGSYSIPLSVNYVRLPGPIKGGSANSGVTYTLNYD